jgi:RNA binding exosome subunit
MKGPIQSVEVTYLIHATEDPGRVERAVSALLHSSAKPELDELEGHFGNKILRARLHLTGDEAEGAFGSMLRSMTPGLRREVLSALPSYLDEHNALFLRLDKQKLVAGTAALGSGDAVRVKVKPRLFLMKGSAARFYEQLIEKA